MATEIEPFPGLGLTDEMRAAVAIEERMVPGPAGAPDVRVLLYRPVDAEGTLPLVLSMHGGAFAWHADHFPAADAGLAMLGAQVVSVDYRSLPDHRFPCAGGLLRRAVLGGDRPRHRSGQGRRDRA